MSVGCAEGGVQYNVKKEYLDFQISMDWSFRIEAYVDEVS